jgi:hypothetical protein
MTLLVVLRHVVQVGRSYLVALLRFDHRLSKAREINCLPACMGIEAQERACVRASRYHVVKAVIAVAAFIFPTMLMVFPIACRAGNPETPHTGFLSDDTWPAPKVYKISLNSDDGTECAGIWYPNGVTMGVDCIGRDCTDDFTVGLRFAVPDLEQGDSAVYARLLRVVHTGM